jgi:Fur family ferric uptake transcriptional regulator
MCRFCNYGELLEQAGLAPTPHRLRVLEVVGNHRSPLSAQEVYETVNRSHAINRVTVYRILDHLVETGVVERISSGGRAFFYGLAPNRHHDRHPHFYCRRCGRLECLQPGSLAWDTTDLERTFPGEIEKVEIRIDGICCRCLRHPPEASVT